jgi:hypothetical protein
MKKLTVKLTPDELRVLTTLASDQLFRLEFIDCRIHGFRQKDGELELGKDVVGRLRSVAEGGTKVENHQKKHRRRS